jgi:hypothetical protein
MQPFSKALQCILMAALARIADFRKFVAARRRYDQKSCRRARRSSEHLGAAAGRPAIRATLQGLTFVSQTVSS